MLRQAKPHCVLQNHLVVILRMYILPALEYAAPLWNAGLTKQQVESLEMIQKRAVKIILGRDHKGYEPALSTLSLPSLSERRQELCNRYAHSLPAKNHMSDLLPFPRENLRNLRSHRKYQVAGLRTQRYEQSSILQICAYLNNVL